MELTGRQSIYLILICSLATKVQTLPSLIAGNLGRFGWAYFLFLGVVDLIFILIGMWITKLAGGKTLYDFLKETVGDVFAKTVSIALGIYFLVSSILPYEALHNVFANILFEDLSWALFSIMLISTVAYLASRGLKTIGRVGELYFRIIGICFIALLVISYSTSSLSRILPLNDFNTSVFFSTSFNFSFWYGDFLLVLMFMGKVKDEKKLTLKLSIAFVIEILIISFAYMILYGIYSDLTVYQSNLVTDISEFALLTLEIGRLDWFLMLGVQTSTIIACGVDVYLASYNFAKVLNLQKSYKVTVFTVIIVYILDIFVFKNITSSAVVVANITKWFALIVQGVLPIVVLIIALNYRRKQCKEKKYVEIS